MTDTETTIWPADKVERRPIASLLPYANNARTHPPAQIAQLAKMIAAYGWTTPVLVDAKGVLIAGHGRILAAQSLGIVDVPTMVATGWTAAQVKAYRLADNSLAAQAGWDNALLLPELEALRIDGFDLELTGFAPDALDQFTAPDLDPAGEWQGMPEFEQPDKTAFQSLIVHFKDAEAVAAFAKLIGQMIGPKTKFAWFPQVERERSADKPWYASDAA